MTDWQQRVIDEQKALDEKIDKLDSFIKANSAFQTLPTEERRRMLAQLYIMQAYSVVLSQRIAAFS